MSFELDIAKFAAKAGKNADKIVRKVCLDITSQVVAGTPVDTGRAKGNWQATIGAPAGAELERDDKTPLKTYKASPSYTQAIITAKDAPGKVFYLTNNLPYIAKLEFGLYGTGDGATDKTNGTGYSVQAPAGWVRLAVARAKAAIAQ